MTLTPEMIAECKRLDVLATKGPLVADLDVFEEGGNIIACVADKGISLLAEIDTDIKPVTKESWVEAERAQAFADAQYFAISRTALPLAIKRVEELEARVRELEDELRNAPRDCYIAEQQAHGPEGEQR